MPHQPRRARSPAATPTHPAATNAITGAIPPFMLQTPPHAPFLTSPLPPSNNPGASIIPGDHAHPRHNLRSAHHTPVANGQTSNRITENSRLSGPGLEAAMSDTEAADDSSLLESAPHDPDDSRRLAGLRDISSLATWTISSSKPGCALPQLRHASPTHFWQSDGPQPHTLTLYFFKLVAIVKIRIYLDFELDESYTPTKMRFFAGMSEGGLVEFGGWEVQETTDPESGETTSGIENVRGWIDIPLQGVGGRETRPRDRESTSQVRKKSHRPGLDENLFEWRRSSLELDAAAESLESPLGENYEEDATTNFTGGDVLKCMVLQVQICENHQNGKDTHVRGFEVFARDETGDREGRRRVKKTKRQATPAEGDEEREVEMVGIREADWMGEPLIR